MPLAIPEIRIGEPLRHEALAVFPLFTKENVGVDYILSSRALADESVVVEEVSESGSVPELLVDNQSDQRVLFLEGEELIGAKQNRILNTSILVAAHSKVKIPVSCVEQGRWRYHSRHFGSSGSHAPCKVRYALKKSVSESVKKQRGHRSDQGEVWSQVDGMHFEHGTSSPSGAMSAAFEANEERRAEYQAKIKYVEGATGLAVAIGQQVVAVDLFDKPSTCQEVWNRLLTGFTMDAIAASAGKAAKGEATIDDVDRLYQKAATAAWEKGATVGEGEEYRAEFEEDQGSALTLSDNLIHGSVLAAV
ncbi:hypothetical protein LOC68_07095 [Blastopirellula sp. JC732]|uniref:ARG and Rhodanese-Phosphatase-superfamily-associated domain-containing protein n=1 Tax=Blastopirellula sediminis TaxID=2894196 RepID=A0A9X1MKE2_9BACT|nr:DUF6569 family protein [Blastopirellula sediminis]MCC9609067.1 hypothetical protein [Blastopirellula sediminis]MCC9628156.1 hypothetical protein [Blastopirellula sediminis]